MSETYKGVCIGGPLDGQWKEHDKIAFRVQEQVGPLTAPADLNIRQTCVAHRYVLEGVSTKDGRVEYWRLESMNTIDSLVRLVQKYATLSFAKTVEVRIDSPFNMRDVGGPDFRDHLLRTVNQKLWSEILQRGVVQYTVKESPNDTVVTAKLTISPACPGDPEIRIDRGS